MSRHSIRWVLMLGLGLLSLAACSGKVAIGENPSSTLPNGRDDSDVSVPLADAGTTVDDATSSSDVTFIDDGDVSAPGCGCTPGNICVASRTVGGPLFIPDDAGTC